MSPSGEFAYRVTDDRILLGQRQLEAIRAWRTLSDPRSRLAGLRRVFSCGDYPCGGCGRAFPPFVTGGYCPVCLVANRWRCELPGTAVDRVRELVAPSRRLRDKPRTVCPVCGMKRCECGVDAGVRDHPGWGSPRECPVDDPGEYRSDYAKALAALEGDAADADALFGVFGC